jgi:signal transduction histidine kinase
MRRGGRIDNACDDSPEEALISRLGELQGQLEYLMASFERCQNAERELQAANRALKTLSKCIEAMTRATDESRLLDDICHIVTDIGGYRMAWIGYAGSDTHKSVCPVARSGYEEGYLEKVDITWSEADPRGRGPTGSAIRTGKPCLIKDVVTDPRFEPWRVEALKRGFKSVLGLPLSHGGSVFGALTIYSDRPDAYDSEEVALLEELARELAYGIMALRDQSERARAEHALEESKAQVELYLDVMGHDINNLNQTAIGFLDLALEKLRAQGRLERGDETLIARPLEALANSTTLIDNVRKLQRERSGELAARVIDVNLLLQEVCQEFRQVPGRDVAIEYRPSCACRVLANDLLKDVFTNIVGNAIKHSAGSLRIAVSLACRGEPPNGACVISIEDNGPGIPDRVKAALLSSQRDARKKMAGRGLGLYIVKTLIEDYGGRLRIEDRVVGDYRRGCRFIVELPSTTA